MSHEQQRQLTQYFNVQKEQVFNLERVKGWLSGRFLEGIRKVSGRCKEDVWKIFGRYLISVWKEGFWCLRLRLRYLELSRLRLIETGKFRGCWDRESSRLGNSMVVETKQKLSRPRLHRDSRWSLFWVNGSTRHSKQDKLQPFYQWIHFTALPLPYQPGLINRHLLFIQFCMLFQSLFSYLLYLTDH